MSIYKKDNRNDPFEECSTNWSLKNKESKNSFQIRIREEEVKRLSAETEQPEEWIVVFANDAKPRDAKILTKEENKKKCETKKEENEGYKWIEIQCEIEEISPQITGK
ncbi:hypothetical protein [Mycoplasma suis]|uniref:hypothetical protein n=1 Tax=Mycoplasma suis TaxID=57372 RepID=UPI0005C45486|nr:hypothetical protein [Mycoplasma suis]